MEQGRVTQAIDGALENFSKGSNQRGMRAHNERLVLSILRRLGPMPKAEIARATGLSAQTVSVMMRRLEAEGLLAKCAPVRGKVGQPSVPMRLAQDGAYFGGFKIGRRSADVVLTDFLGQVLSRARITYDYPRPEATLAFAQDSFERLADQLGPSRRGRISGLGVAMPFRLWDWVNSLNLPPEDMLGWRDLDITAELESRLNLPVFMQNDASSACGAELVFGAEDRARDFLYFYVGYFVGGGVVLNNRLLAGSGGNAGALGSIPVQDGQDGQGGQVQLIDLASLFVLERAMTRRGLDPDTLWEPPAAWAVPPDLLEPWVNRAAEGLAQAIVSAVCVLDLPEVMIDGWIPQHLRAQLVAKTNAAVDRLDLSGVARPTIRAGHVGPDARVLGAASLPLSHRFLVE